MGQRRRRPPLPGPWRTEREHHDSRSPRRRFRRDRSVCRCYPLDRRVEYKEPDVGCSARECVKSHPNWCEGALSINVDPLCAFAGPVTATKRFVPTETDGGETANVRPVPELAALSDNISETAHTDKCKL